MSDAPNNASNQAPSQAPNLAPGPGAQPQDALRQIQDTVVFDPKRFFLRWEWLLVALLLAVNIINSNLSPNYLVLSNIMDAIRIYADKMILIFPMMMIILIGDIDISVASTMALSGVLMGVSHSAGLPMPLAMVLALLTGAVCGTINGLILAKYQELAAMIVTLSTMIIYRGVASVILEDRAAGGFPDWFSFIGWGSLAGLPVILVFFILEAAVFVWVIHYTAFGRSLYAIGNNAEAARYSGIDSKRVKVALFAIMGVFASVAGIFLASKMGSVRPSMAKGYELDVIAMVVLGGVSTSGGQGRVIGVFIAAFIIGFLRYGLGLVNVPSPTILVLIGCLLIVAAAIPNLKNVMARRAKPAS
jgi:rhamnose transport system permease protein